MKEFVCLFLAQLKRILKNKTNAGMLVIFPFAMIILIFLMRFVLDPKKPMIRKLKRPIIPLKWMK